MQNGIADAAVQEWCRNVSAISAVDFRRHVFRRLRFPGWLEESVRDAHPHDRQVEAFVARMRDDRGLSEATIGNCFFESDRLNPDRIRRGMSAVRRWIEDARAMITYNVDTSNESARQKGHCLIDILDNQLLICQLIEAGVDEITETFPAYSFEPRHFPRLFDSDSAVKPRK